MDAISDDDLQVAVAHNEYLNGAALDYLRSYDRGAFVDVVEGDLFQASLVCVVHLECQKAYD